jgi:hypothetical protein
MAALYLPTFLLLPLLPLYPVYRIMRRRSDAPRRVSTALLGIILLVLMVSMQPTLLQAQKVLNSGNPDAKRLYDDLLSNYNKLVRPVVNTTDPLTVRIKLKLSQLIDVVSQQPFVRSEAKRPGNPSKKFCFPFTLTRNFTLFPSLSSSRARGINEMRRWTPSRGLKANPVFGL